jgi:hypothetical protein
MFRCLLWAIAAAVWPKVVLIADNLCLRQQLLVLLRRKPRPRLKDADRRFWVLACRWFVGWRTSLLIVKPETVLGRHRHGWRTYWRRHSRRRKEKPGRRPIPPELRTLIRRMTIENQLWGQRRIQAELARLGFKVSARTVAKYMHRTQYRGPSSRWRSFLTQHASSVCTCPGRPPLRLSAGRMTDRSNFCALQVRLSATLWSGLGTNATRSAALSAERAKATTSIQADRAELARLTSERGAMVFTPASEASVEAARAAVTAAEQVRIAECDQRGPHCRQRETEEADKRGALAAALTNKALTDKATKLESDAAAIRARLHHTAPAIEADPQASAFSQLTNIAADKAAALYAFWISLAFEIGAMLAMLIAYSNTVPVAEPAARTMVIAGVPLAASKNVVPMVPRQPKPAMIIGRHMLKRLARVDGEEVPLAAIYSDLCRWCAEQSIAPPSVAEFGQETRELFARHDIQTRTEGKVIVVVGMKLVA